MAKQPSHFVYYVKRPNKTNGKTKGYWAKVGAAWIHKDGKGSMWYLNSFPLENHNSCCGKRVRK
jgi:hypothetical protein